MVFLHFNTHSRKIEKNFFRTPALVQTILGVQNFCYRIKYIFKIEQSAYLLLKKHDSFLTLYDVDVSNIVLFLKEVI